MPWTDYSSAREVSNPPVMAADTVGLRWRLSKTLSRSLTGQLDQIYRVYEEISMANVLGASCIGPTNMPGTNVCQHRARRTEGYSVVSVFLIASLHM